MSYLTSALRILLLGAVKAIDELMTCISSFCTFNDRLLNKVNTLIHLSSLLLFGLHTKMIKKSAMDILVNPFPF